LGVGGIPGLEQDLDARGEVTVNHDLLDEVLVGTHTDLFRLSATGLAER
jgi:hypothetical protein